LRSDKKKNPITGRDFNPKSSLYKTFEKNCKDLPVPKIDLFNYQKEHVEEVVELLKKNQVVLDTSETGTGKTFTSTFAAKKLKLKVFVICPVPVRDAWIDALSNVGVEILSVTNYESLKGTKPKDGKKGSSPKCYKGSSNKKEVCPYLKLTWEKLGQNKTAKYSWKLPENSLIIVDEAHKSKNAKSMSSKLIKSLYEQIKSSKKKYLLLLTATPLEKESNYKYIQTLFGLDNMNKNQVLQFVKDNSVRMKIDDYRKEKNELTEKIEINTKLIQISKKDGDELAKKYEEIQEIRERKPDLKNVRLQRPDDEEEEKPKKKSSFGLGVLQSNTQEIEAIKSSYLPQIIDKYINKGNSVLVFTTFKKSIKIIQKGLDELGIDYVIVTGDEKESVQKYNIKKFNEGKVKVIMLTIKTGGTGINLQDKTGENPRVSLILPPWSMTELVQTFGRTERVGTKSKSKAYLIFAYTKDFAVENMIKEALDKKLETHISIVDEDLSEILEKIREEPEEKIKKSEEKKAKKSSKKSEKKSKEKLTEEKLCQKWIKNKTVNPKTGREIKVNGPMYRYFAKLCR